MPNVLNQVRRGSRIDFSFEKFILLGEIQRFRRDF